MSAIFTTMLILVLSIVALAVIFILFLTAIALWHQLFTLNRKTWCSINDIINEPKKIKAYYWYSIVTFGFVLLLGISLVINSALAMKPIYLLLAGMIFFGFPFGFKLLLNWLKKQFENKFGYEISVHLD